MTEMPVRRIPVRPGGAHATIDVAEQNAALAALLGGDTAARERAVTTILAAPELFAPPVLCALAAELFARDRRDDAVFWYHAGQVRARFDANRCADPTAGSAVAVLRERFGAPINRYAFTDRANLRTLVERAVQWDATTPHDYDHRWINLHGMGAFTAVAGGAGLSRPEEEWADVAARTRAEYLRGMHEVLG
ncbi:hypothetical protein BJF78_03670 [Pseudonocardia sp. CNS-139]|nr:hypothetical protein BJF78_03670 [Pseudonocardia sp. CNS-139]